MHHPTIISDGQALRILRNMLRKEALEKHSVELAAASEKERDLLVAKIESEIDAAVKMRRKELGWNAWIPKL